jgi:hypothetical protein
MSNTDPGTPRHSGFVRQLLTNPIALGAVVTAYVALNTAIFGYLTTRNTQQLAREKFEFESSLEERKYETGLILEVVKEAAGDQQLSLHRLCLLAATGLIPKTAETLKLLPDSGCHAAAAKP